MTPISAARPLPAVAGARGNLVERGRDTHIPKMTDTLHRFAIDAASDGRFHILEKRSADADGRGFAAYRWPSPNEHQAFETAAAAMAFARDNLDATDADFAELPGLP